MRSILTTFISLYLVSQVTQASQPLDLFWQQPKEIKTLNETFSTSRRLSYKQTYDNLWRDDSGSAKHNQRNIQAGLPVITNHPDLHGSIAINYLSDTFEFSKREEDEWSTNIEKQIKEPSLNISAVYKTLLLAATHQDQRKEWLAGFGKLDKFYFYLWEREETYTWDIGAELPVITSEEIAEFDDIDPNHTYQIDLFQRRSEKRQGIGGAWKAKSNQFEFAYLTGERSGSQLIKLENHTQLSQQIDLSLQYYQDQNLYYAGPITIDDDINGVSRVKGEIRNSYGSITFPFKAGEMEVYLKETQWDFGILGLYNARALAGYWSSLFLDDGRIFFDSRFNYRGIGIYWTPNSPPRQSHNSQPFGSVASVQQGFNWNGHLGLGRFNIDSSGRHEVERVPVGFWENEPLTLETSRADILLLEFELKHAWNQLQITYKISQPAPFNVKTNDDSDSSPGSSGSSDDSSKWDQLPDGNRQTLELNYYF